MPVLHFVLANHPALTFVEVPELLCLLLGRLELLFLEIVYTFFDVRAFKAFSGCICPLFRLSAAVWYGSNDIIPIFIFVY